MDPMAVVFDLDHTLAVTRRDRQTLLDVATDAAGVRRIDRTEYLEAHGRNLATQTREPLFAAILEAGDPAAVARTYREAIETDLEPLPGVESLLSDLGDRYRLGLLTDGPARAQYGKLDKLGWRDRFDAVVVTGELPAGKPDPRTFERVLAELEVAPQEVLFVGDNPEADIEGAAAAGIYAVQVLEDGATPSPAADATVRADSLATDLRGLLLD
jgi:putative hydrolase of the HAD superfamily